MIPRDQALKLVDEERLRQDMQHGPISVHGHPIMEWATIVRVLLAKQEREWYDGSPAFADAPVHRMVQVAAVGLGAVEQHGDAAYRRYVEQRTLHPAFAAAHGAMLEKDFMGSEAKEIFHDLWGAAAAQPGYDKDKWTRLQAALRNFGVPV